MIQGISTRNKTTIVHYQIILELTPTILHNKTSPTYRTSSQTKIIIITIIKKSLYSDR